MRAAIDFETHCPMGEMGHPAKQVTQVNAVIYASRKTNYWRGRRFVVASPEQLVVMTMPYELLNAKHLRGR